MRVLMSAFSMMAAPAILLAQGVTTPAMASDVDTSRSGVQTASTEDSESWPTNFYTGGDWTGTKMPVNMENVGECRTIPLPAYSLIFYTDQPVSGIDIFYNPDCQTGAPGTTGDLYTHFSSLNAGGFPYQAISYRVTKWK